MPATQVLPFDVTQPYPTQINGVALPTYIDWMRACSDITVTGHPAISLPCGETPEGMPCGLQLVGRRNETAGLAGAALRCEAHVTTRAPSSSARP